MGSSYRQFCPVAKSMELLDERWTLLVVRELLSGSTHFNDIRRGLPKMSPTLLSTRLRHLARTGVVERRTQGSEVVYTLTEAGLELRPVVEALGVWGTRWIGALGEEDLDPQLLLWDLHRNIDHSAVPPGRTVVRFRFPDVPARTRDWWLVVTPADADVCDVDPGHEVGALVTVSLRRMVEVWRGDVTWSSAVRSGVIEVHGPRALSDGIPRWLLLSKFTAVPRPRRPAAAELTGGRGAGQVRSSARSV